MLREKDAAMGESGVQRLRALLGMNAHVDSALNDSGQQPLVALALRKGDTAAAKFLLKKGADPSLLLRWSFVAVDKVLSASSIVDLLVEADVDMNVSGDDAHRWSLLHYLVLNDDLDTIEKLLSRVDTPTVQSVNSLGDSSLTLALKLGRQNIAEILLERSSLSHADPAGDCALHLAIRQGYKDLVNKMVVEYGDDINSIDAFGNTALHLALKCRLHNLVKTIAATDGAEIDARDKEGNDTALTLQ